MRDMMRQIVKEHGPAAAVTGVAQAAIEEIDEQKARLQRLLTAMDAGTGAPRRATPAKAEPRRRRRMSAAQRKAVSVRMRKYWQDLKRGGKRKAR